MTGSTYAPQTWNDVETSKVKPAVSGIMASITAGTTQNVDTLFANDSLIRGINIMAKTATYGDNLTISVIDIAGVYAPANTVLSVPVSNYYLSSDQISQEKYESVCPFKLLGGLYVRIAYTSTAGGLLPPAVAFTVNFLMLQCLI